ncbi:hypothetical protein D3C87_1016860 [compost metagenome]
MAWLGFILLSPWRVIGVCAILTFTAWNFSQLAKFRFVEHTTINNTVTKEEQTNGSIS